MLNRAYAVGICLAAVLTLGTVAAAQHAGTADHFTFAAMNASKAGGSADGRFQIVISQWSPDPERNRLVSVLTDEGSGKLAESFRLGPVAGYLYWPGGLEYIIRFAYHAPRADGGEDVILATDYPVDLWWDRTLGAPPTSFGAGSVIQLRLNRDGRGEGKLSVGTKLMAMPDGKMFGLEDYAKQPVVLTDVQRDKRTTS